MGGDLDWKSNTNTTENSCKIAQCDCLTFWEVYQQVAMQRLSNLKDAKQNLYRLEEGYEARARRIAAAYAKIFLEKEINGNVNLKGRYYWMGLGAFASKTVANVFDHWGSQTGYSAPIIVNTIKEPIDLFALGNLWLFMDIAPWHYAWSASSKTFDSCRTQRNISKFTHIKKEVMNLPWSSCLPEIKYLGSTEQIKDAFALLPQIEKIFLGERTEKRKYNAAKKYLFDHLMFIAVQEQFNILQTVVWNKASAQWGAEKQRSWYMGWAMPDATLVLSSDYDVDEVKEGWFSSSDKAKRASELPEEVYISPFSDTKAENYDSRMIWIKKAAEKYHRLMLDDKGRAFLHQELKTITGWSQSKANFLFGIHPSSNEGKK